MTPDTSPKDDDQLARFRQELNEGTWVANARRRSRRRKSPWNILLLVFGVALWAAIAAVIGWAGATLHGSLHPTAVPLFDSGPLRMNSALVLFPSIFAALCPALLLTNFLVYLIPPARRAMEAEDREYPGTDYTSSRRALSKLGLWIWVICLPIALVGILVS
jgi:H+/gluconate symporter-like permease